ncbi:MAG: GGDEF domain-containing protein, partial [Burkholderiales bacterium]
KILRSSFRIHDQIYRFGGEEFIVVLDRTEPIHARNVFERLRDKVQSHAFPQIPSVTISIGYTQIQSADTPFLAFSRADKAMYYAKSHGRNRVCQYEELVELGHIVESQAWGDLELFSPG